MIDDKVTTRTIVPIQMESILEAIMPFNNNGGHQGIVECSNTKICSAISSTASSLDETKPKIVAVSNHKKPSTVSMNNEHASSTTSKSKGGTTRRRGKWTVEEEEYVARVIQDFNSGFLDAPAGYTLRSFLSDKLQCDPMRITKKFTGDSCIGKRVFHPAVRSATNSEVIDTAQTELDALEKRWKQRLEAQQRESAKKAAASAAAATAASRGTVNVQGVPVAMLGVSSLSSSDSRLQQTAVTRAATWLDKANVILMGETGSCSNDCSEQNDSDECHSTAEESLEEQLKNLQRLICEGPVIQQTTADLPNLLTATTRTDIDINTVTTVNQMQKSDSILSASTTINTRETSIPALTANVLSLTHESADKLSKVVDESNVSGTEDAEALVGFLRSVRASASGHEL